MHYRGILLCNTCPGSISEHEVYSKKSHRLCKSEATLLCVFCENGFTILNVEYSERYVPV